MKLKFTRCIILIYIVASAAVHKLQVTNFCMVAPRIFEVASVFLENLCMSQVVQLDIQCSQTLNVEFVVNIVPPCWLHCCMCSRTDVMQLI